MKVTPLRIPEVLLIEPQLFQDDRGWFFEEYRDEAFREQGLPSSFRQENRSRSKRGVVRGLHFQLTRPQGKLVTCTHGELFDVAVDVRRGSPTFGQWAGVELRGDAPRLLWIPEGFAHGFCALSEYADLAYKCTEVYVREDERGIPWNDPALAIPWPVRVPIVSARDQGFTPLSASGADLPEYPRRAR